MTALRPLAAGMRAAAAEGRTVVPVDGFVLYLAPESSAPHLSLAIPSETAPTDWRAALAALPAAFAAQGRSARIEAFVELHPGLVEAAASLGWRTAMTAPVMALVRGSLTPMPAGAAAYRAFDPADDARLTAALRGAHLAFGGSEDDPDATSWRPRLLRGLANGAILAGGAGAAPGPPAPAAARPGGGRGPPDPRGAPPRARRPPGAPRAAAPPPAGVPRAGAALQRGGDVAELAGVWTHPAFRRRGLAHAACHALLAAGFAAGVAQAWLSAAEGALTLYQRLGFERVGTQVNLDAP